MLVALPSGRFLDDHDIGAQIGFAPHAYDHLVEIFPNHQDTAAGCLAIESRADGLRVEGTCIGARVDSISGYTDDAV